MYKAILLLLVIHLCKSHYIDADPKIKGARKETACVNKPFSLKCECVSPGTPIHWRKEPDTCIVPNENYSINNEENKLDILHVTTSDAGYYQCSANFGQKAYIYLEIKECLDVDRSISIFGDDRCTICEPPSSTMPITFTEEPKSQRVSTRSIVALYCGVSRWDTTEIYWYKGDQRLNDRPIRSARTGLIIYDFDSYHVGCYKCIVHFPGGTIESLAHLELRLSWAFSFLSTVKCFLTMANFYSKCSLVPLDVFAFNAMKLIQLYKWNNNKINQTSNAEAEFVPFTSYTL